MIQGGAGGLESSGGGGEYPIVAGEAEGEGESDYGEVFRVAFALIIPSPESHGGCGPTRDAVWSSATEVATVAHKERYK